MPASCECNLKYEHLITARISQSMLIKIIHTLILVLHRFRQESRETQSCLTIQLDKSTKIKRHALFEKPHQYDLSEQICQFELNDIINRIAIFPGSDH